MRQLKIVALIALGVAGLLASVSSASAAPTDPWVYKSTFSEEFGADITQMEVNYATGNVLVAANDGYLYQFDASGNPAVFAATGTTKLFIGTEGTNTHYFSIDNSGGPTQGNIYVIVSPNMPGSALPGYFAFRADGSRFGNGYQGPGEFIPALEAIGEGFALCAVTPAPDGNLWVAVDNGNIVETTPTGEPTGRRAHLLDQLTYSYACPMRFDDKGHFYAGNGDLRFDASDFSYEGPTGMPGDAVFAIDPSTDDIYKAGADKPTGFPPQGYVYSVPYTDPLVKQTPYEPISRKTGPSDGTAVTFDSTGKTLYFAERRRIRIFHREPPSPPYGLTPSSAVQIRTQGAVMRGSFFAGGAPTTYRFEYGTTTAYGQTTESLVAPFKQYETDVTATALGLQPNTTYHVRMVATNSAGTTYGPDGIIRTYPVGPGGGADPCPNALARKQTVAQRLPDCRAYELASAPDSGGYDVESYLAPGQSPFPGFPLATDKLLYATHAGAVPGPWNATNKGPDPYLATRTPDGWVTRYEGLPSDLNEAAGSFSSDLGEASSSLSTLAFAGPGLCSPCFTAGGLETGIPVRLPDGQLVQGMAGSLSGGVPAGARPEGKVAKYFSGDGRKLLFASKYAFEPGANDDDGTLTVYERDLGAARTEIVSTDPAGNALTGTVSELDVSGDGSRTVIGQGVSTDSQGNEYVHPYLHLAGTPGSVDLAPGTTSGVLYAGMTSDGAKVFFTTPDKLLPADTDNSADLYEADVDPSGELSLRLVSDSNSDACEPVADENGAHWNTTGANEDCSVVAIGGGGGIASQTGAAYFLSPEELGGEGTPDEPNLYLAQPGGQISLLATLEPDNPLVLDSVKAAATRKSADFQTTPDGSYAAFTSNLGLSGLSTHGFRSVYRYAAADEQLDCVSCDRTGTTEASVFAAAELPPDGLALLADGKLFFTTRAQLVINDANAKKDVYVFSGGAPLLISAGTGPFDSGLLSASADGTDVFFFTRDPLAREEDHNGGAMRIYDAREGGGFFKLPSSVPCQASDECHGPGAPSGSAPPIRSSGQTTPGNVLLCARNRVKKRGTCVKKPVQRKKHAKKRKGGTKKRNAKTTGKRGGRNA